MDDIFYHTTSFQSKDYLHLVRTNAFENPQYSFIEKKHLKEVWTDIDVSNVLRNYSFDIALPFLSMICVHLDLMDHYDLSNDTMSCKIQSSMGHATVECSFVPAPDPLPADTRSSGLHDGKKFLRRIRIDIRPNNETYITALRSIINRMFVEGLRRRDEACNVHVLSLSSSAP